MKSEDWREMLTKEVKTIQAIYEDDNVNYSEGNGSPEIVLKLAPLQSVEKRKKDIHVRVDLRVLFTIHYPYEPPDLKLENAKGISNENLLQLMENLNKVALSLCGEVMVLKLAHHVQEFLHSQNVSSLSFHDQMLANQKKLEKIELLERKKLQEVKYAEDEGLIQLIEQESTHLSSKVLFDGIIRYHMLEVSQDNLNIKLLVDNLNGLPLSSFIHEGGMPISFIFEICKQLIEKLEFLHSLSVIHRDLNLCNTFIGSSNKLIISGYGVMKRISDYVNMFTEEISCNNEVQIMEDVFFRSYQKIIKPGKKGDIFYMYFSQEENFS